MQRDTRSKWKCKKIAEEMIKKGAVKKSKKKREISNMITSSH